MIRPQFTPKGMRARAASASLAATGDVGESTGSAARALAHIRDKPRVLENGCTSCGYSKVYCHAVLYLDDKPYGCCPDCSH